MKIRFGLPSLIVSVAVICVAAALALPALHRARRERHAASCVGRLCILWKLQGNYAVQFGGPDRRMVAETGGRFWTALARTDPPLIDPMIADILACPFQGSPPEPGGTSYRGPTGPIERHNDSDPVGADREYNHGRGAGGNVLRKSGDVFTVEAADPLWRLAAEKTEP